MTDDAKAQNPLRPSSPQPGGGAFGSKPGVPRLALSLDEAAVALGVSRDYFDEHLRDELRVVRRGRRVLVPVRELEAWLAREARRALADE